MTRKQKDYLSDLLADEPDEAPAPAQPPVAASTPPAPRATPVVAAPTPLAPAPATHRAGLSLLGRESALARVATGEVKQVTQLQIDPSKVRVWAGNARLQQHLSEESVRDLIDSIIAEGGQKVPVVVRHVSDDPDHAYEVIAGTRRHFAISWLRANSYPEMKLLAQVADLDDEAAFRLADLENRARKDVSDIERARNYASALDQHYGGKAVRMAERLRVSKGWLSKMLKAATLPDAVLAAFANLGELTLNPAYALASAMDDKGRAQAILKEAAAIAGENKAALKLGAPALPGALAHKRLMAAQASKGKAAADAPFEVTGKFGRPILAVKSVNRQGVTLHLPTGGGADEEQLVAALRSALADLRVKGITLA